MNKKDEKWVKKGFEQLLGARSTQKLVEIHNKRHKKYLFDLILDAKLELAAV